MSQYASEDAWNLEDVDVDELLAEIKALDATPTSTKPPIHPRAPAQKNSIATGVRTPAIASPIYPSSTALLPQCGWFTPGKTEISILSDRQKSPGDAYVARPTTARPSQVMMSSQSKNTCKSSIFQAAATTNLMLQQPLSSSPTRDSRTRLTNSFNL